MKKEGEYTYDPPLADIVKLLLGEDKYNWARDSLILDKMDACKKGDHAWKRIAYDLQGGKWGTERCIRCGHTETWTA